MVPKSNQRVCGRTQLDSNPGFLIIRQQKAQVSSSAVRLLYKSNAPLQSQDFICLSDMRLLISTSHAKLRSTTEYLK